MTDESGNIIACNTACGANLEYALACLCAKPDADLRSERLAVMLVRSFIMSALSLQLTLLAVSKLSQLLFWRLRHTRDLRKSFSAQLPKKRFSHPETFFSLARGLSTLMSSKTHALTPMPTYLVIPVIPSQS